MEFELEVKKMERQKECELEMKKLEKQQESEKFECQRRERGRENGER